VCVCVCDGGTVCVWEVRACHCASVARCSAGAAESPRTAGLFQWFGLCFPFLVCVAPSFIRPLPPSHQHNPTRILLPCFLLPGYAQGTGQLEQYLLLVNSTFCPEIIREVEMINIKYDQMKWRHPGGTGLMTPRMDCSGINASWRIGVAVVLEHVSIIVAMSIMTFSRRTPRKVRTVGAVRQQELRSYLGKRFEESR